MGLMNEGGGCDAGVTAHRRIHGFVMFTTLMMLCASSSHQALYAFEYSRRSAITHENGSIAGGQVEAWTSLIAIAYQGKQRGRAYYLHLTALSNDNIQIGHVLPPVASLCRLHLLHNVHPVNDLAKDDVLAVQEGRGHSGDEELRAVGV